MFAWSNQLIFPSSHIDARLAFLEERFRVFSSANDDSSINRITSRMHRLEQRISNTTSNITLSNTNRRIHKLERRMKKLMERLNADNCSSNPCHNGATCSNTFGGYNCRCSDAWTGVNCEEDVNECAIFAGTDLGCQNSVSCENTQGGYMLVELCILNKVMCSNAGDSLKLYKIIAAADANLDGWESIARNEQ